MTKIRKPLWRRLLRSVVTVLLSVLAFAVFYLAVILLQPQQPEEAAVPTDQPLLTASPAMHVADAADLAALMDSFPAPALCCTDGSGMTLISGSAYDAPFENGFGRILLLTYQTADGTAFTLQTIYPARAVSLIPDDDYRIGATAGHRLAGLPSVRMEKPGSIRLHAQGSEALYVLTLPDSIDTPATVTRAFQLYTPQ